MVRVPVFRCCLLLRVRVLADVLSSFPPFPAHDFFPSFSLPTLPSLFLTSRLLHPPFPLLTHAHTHTRTHAHTHTHTHCNAHRTRRRRRRRHRPLMRICRRPLMQSRGRLSREGCPPRRSRWCSDWTMSKNTVEFVFPFALLVFLTSCEPRKSSTLSMNILLIAVCLYCFLV